MPFFFYLSFSPYQCLFVLYSPFISLWFPSCFVLILFRLFSTFVFCSLLTTVFRIHCSILFSFCFFSVFLLVFLTYFSVSFTAFSSLFFMFYPVSLVDFLHLLSHVCLYMHVHSFLCFLAKFYFFLLKNQSCHLAKFLNCFTLFHFFGRVFLLFCYIYIYIYIYIYSFSNMKMNCFCRVTLN